jgi:ubiquitin C-terminal hydrolase
MEILPVVLFINIMRYIPTKKNDYYQRLDVPVIFPKTLAAERFGATFTREQYELFAVCCHTGTKDSGHFYAYVKPGYTIANDSTTNDWKLGNTWVFASDDKVRVVGEEDVYAEETQRNFYFLLYKLIK